MAVRWKDSVVPFNEADATCVLLNRVWNPAICLVTNIYINASMNLKIIYATKRFNSVSAFL